MLKSRPCSLKESGVHLSTRVSNLEAESSPSVWYETMKMMRERVADHITREHIKTRKEEFSTVYSIDLFVLSPDELYGLIEKEARELYKLYSFPKVYEVSDK